MTNPPSVRCELKKEMIRQGYTLSSFSKVSGVNRGVLSSTLSDTPTKSLSMNQLDQMNVALHRPKDWLYELYTEELINEIETVSWRKVKDLLIRCVQLEKTNLIISLLNALKDKTTYVNYIFEFAEEVMEQGSTADLQMFYQYVLDHESNLHAERFAISQYRLFRLNLGLDLQKSFKSTVQFSPYRHALPTYLKLDALAQLINVSFAIKDWDALKQFGEELVDVSMLVYKAPIEQQHLHTKQYERSLVIYYGKGYVAQFAALEAIGEYQKAKDLIPYFEDLSWFKSSDIEGKIYTEKYAVVAKCNRYNIQLLQGNYTVLKAYIDYLEFFPEEHPASIEIIVKASTLHGWDIDDILEKYHATIYPADILNYLESTTQYSMIVETNRYTNVYYELALYYFQRKKSNTQLENILAALKQNIENYNRIHAFDSTELFEKLYKFYF